MGALCGEAAMERSPAFGTYMNTDRQSSAEEPEMATSHAVESMAWNRSMHADALADVEEYPAVPAGAAAVSPEALAKVRANLEEAMAAQQPDS
jgi:hypothetical protein